MCTIVLGHVGCSECTGKSLKGVEIQGGAPLFGLLRRTVGGGASYLTKGCLEKLLVNCGDRSLHCCSNVDAQASGSSMYCVYYKCHSSAFNSSTLCSERVLRAWAVPLVASEQVAPSHMSLRRPFAEGDAMRLLLWSTRTFRRYTAGAVVPGTSCSCSVPIRWIICFVSSFRIVELHWGPVHHLILPIFL